MHKAKLLLAPLLLVSLTLLCATVASADTVTWTLTGITFNPVNLCCGTNEGAGGTATGFFVDPTGGTGLVSLTSWSITTTDTSGNPAYGPTFTWNPSDSTAVLETDIAGNVGIGLASTAVCSGQGQQPTNCRTMGLFTSSTSLNPSLSPISIDNNFGLEAVFNCNTGNVFCDETSRNYNPGGSLVATSVVTTPEPATLSLMGIGLVFAGVYRRRQDKNS
jgi:hypothetical protein